MAEKRNPVLLSAEEAAKLDPAEIGKGVAAEGEVEAQSGYNVPCSNCNKRYWNAKDFRYTQCPYCGHITKWW